MDFTKDFDNILRQIIGKKFKLQDFSKSLKVSSEELVELLFKLQEDEYLDFVPFPDGTIRISKVGELVAKGDITAAKLFEFPNDYSLSRLVIFGLTLDIEYRMEFNKCMENEDFVEKFKSMEEGEIKDFLKIRVDFYKEKNQAELDKAKKDKEDLEFRKQQKNKATPLSEDDKKNIAEAQAKYKTGKEARVIKTKKGPMTDLRKKHELEKKRNLLRYGIAETNNARIARLKREEEREAQKEAFKERIESRKENVINYEVGQVLDGIVVKVIRFGVYVDIGESDGFIKTEDLSNINIELSTGSKIECKIINIDLKRRNIDLIPVSIKPNDKTSAKIKSKPMAKPKPSSNKPDKSDKELLILKKEKKRVDEVLQNIIDSGGKDSLTFFTRLIKKNIKENGLEWSITIPKNRKNRVRLNNYGLEGAYIDDKGIMLVLLNSDVGSPAEIKYLIDKYVPAKDRQGKYRKVPKAVPLFLNHKELVGKKQFLYKGYCQFFMEAKLTGKNSWKKAHSDYAIKQLSKLLSIDLKQPEYLK
tara:strand:+ start:5248 stop:6840 length:1593 start_codon:yes stop_codon:yes gene_type:complete